VPLVSAEQLYGRLNLARKSSSCRNRRRGFGFWDRRWQLQRAIATEVWRAHRLEVDEAAARREAEQRHLRALIAKPFGRAIARQAQIGERVAVYTQPNRAPRILVLGPERRYQDPPPNFGATAGWRDSMWTLAGVLTLTAQDVPPRRGAA
jgi:hypothetical protein